MLLSLKIRKIILKTDKNKLNINKIVLLIHIESENRLLLYFIPLNSRGAFLIFY